MAKKTSPGKKAALTKKRRAAGAKAAATRRRRAAGRKAAATKRGRAAWKPATYTSVAPYIIVGGAQRLIEFLKQVFDATELRRYAMPDGTIMHAEVRIDDTVVMMADAGGEWGPAPMNMHVYVPDVDATYERALAAGGTSAQDPSEREGDPDKRGGFKDPGGNTWWIGTQKRS